MPATVTRDELYVLVWTEPMQQVARRFDVSDVAVAKVCRRMGIPMPGRGYWARELAGRRVKQAPLPHPLPAAPLVHTFHGALRSSAEEAIPLLEIVIAPEVRHPLLLKARPVLERPGVKTTSYRCEHTCPAIEVSAAQLDRALRILDALFLACAERGMEPVVTRPGERSEGYARRYPDPRSKTGFLLGDAFVEIQIEEGIDVVELPPLPAPARPRSTWTPPRKFENRPSGELSFRIVDGHTFGLRKLWRDGKAPLESKLPSVLQGIETYAHRLVKEAEEAEIRRRKWEEEAQVCEAAARLQALEERLRSDLAHRLDFMREASAIRNLLARLPDPAGAGEVESLALWRRWAKERADALERRGLKDLWRMLWRESWGQHWNLEPMGQPDLRESFQARAARHPMESGRE